MSARTAHRWLGLVGLVAAVLVGGCVAPAQPSPGSSTPGGLAPTAAPLPIVPVEPPWLDLGSRPSGGLGAQGLVGRTYVVWHTTDPREVVVERRSDHGVVLRHRSEPARYWVSFVDLAGDRLVVVDERIDGSAHLGGARAYVYDLRTGTRTAVSDVASAPPLSVLGGQATVTDDGRYYYSASVDGRSLSCVAVLDLGTMTGHTVDCAGPGEGETVGYTVLASEDGASWLHVAGPTFASCRTGRALRQGRVVTVGPPGDCGMLGATTVGGWDVWAGMRYGFTQATPTSLVRATNGLATVELGLVDGVALTTCGG